jgi:hypothetical protein
MHQPVFDGILMTAVACILQPTPVSQVEEKAKGTPFPGCLSSL